MSIEAFIKKKKEKAMTSPTTIIFWDYPFYFSDII